MKNKTKIFIKAFTLYIEILDGEVWLNDYVF